MKTSLNTHCPICNGKTTTKGKNGFSLCPVHSWVKGSQAITIIKN